VARLPYRFSRLDVIYFVGYDEATEAMDALIQANADVLSSLRVHLFARKFEDLNRNDAADFYSTTQEILSLKSSQNTCSVSRIVQIYPN